MTPWRPHILAGVLALCAGLATGEAAKPWSDKPVLDDPDEFHFGIFADRTGGERPRFFAEAMRALNLLRPAFVMCVGDLIQNGYGLSEAETEKLFRRQWQEVLGLVGRLDMRFYNVVGNHDIANGWGTRQIERDVSLRLWKELFGPKTYYDFWYRGCHFVCLDSMECRDSRAVVTGLSARQVDWARETVLAGRDKARWTFLFMHMPIDWTSDRWLAFERAVNGVDYTVFCGDWHNHVKAVRHGKNYYMIGTSGGSFDRSVARDDLRYGIMDSVTWVTMTKKGPVVSNLALSGIHGDEIQRCATTRGWIETPLDYPDHLTEPAGTYALETNPAVIPTERTAGEGYDWHFRHAMILRNNDLLIRPEVVLAGDDAVHNRCPDWYGDRNFPRPACLTNALWSTRRVMNIGCSGDTTANLLWRLVHGELAGTAPELVVVAMGGSNLRAGHAPMQTADGVAAVVARIHREVPRARVLVYPPFAEAGLDPVARAELAARLAKRLAQDPQTTYVAFEATCATPGRLSAADYARWEDSICEHLKRESQQQNKE